MPELLGLAKKNSRASMELVRKAADANAKPGCSREPGPLDEILGRFAGSGPLKRRCHDANQQLCFVQKNSEVTPMRETRDSRTASA
jgi:hypothetical protein